MASQAHSRLQIWSYMWFWPHTNWHDLACSIAMGVTTKLSKLSLSSHWRTVDLRMSWLHLARFPPPSFYLDHPRSPSRWLLRYGPSRILHDSLHRPLDPRSSQNCRFGDQTSRAGFACWWTFSGLQFEQLWESFLFVCPSHLLIKGTTQSQGRLANDRTNAWGQGRYDTENVLTLHVFHHHEVSEQQPKQLLKVHRQSDLSPQVLSTWFVCPGVGRSEQTSADPLLHFRPHFH